jgi:hypothetical protein
VFVPILHVLYVICFYAAFGFPIAVIYFFFMPFVSIASILAFENFSHAFKSITPLWMLLGNPDPY